MVMFGWHILNRGFNDCLVIDGREDKCREASSYGFCTKKIDPRYFSESLVNICGSHDLPFYTSNDQCVASLNLILKSLGYSYCEQKVLDLISDKYKLLSFLRDHDLIKRDFDTVPLGAKCFRKPRSGASSVGVQLDEFDKSHDMAHENSFVYEGILLGVEFSVDGVIDSNGNLIAAVGKKFKYNGYRFSPVSTAVIYEPISRAQIFNYFKEVCKVVGLKNTAVHGEVILTSYGPELVEISARQTGFTGPIILPACGMPFLELLKGIQNGEIVFNSDELSLPKEMIIYYFYENVNRYFSDSELDVHGFHRLVDGKALDSEILDDDVAKTGFEVLSYSGKVKLSADEAIAILRGLEFV